MWHIRNRTDARQTQCDVASTTCAIPLPRAWLLRERGDRLHSSGQAGRLTAAKNARPHPMHSLAHNTDAKPGKSRADR